MCAWVILRMNNAFNSGHTQRTSLRKAPFVHSVTRSTALEPSESTCVHAAPTVPVPTCPAFRSASLLLGPHLHTRVSLRVSYSPHADTVSSALLTDCSLKQKGAHTCCLCVHCALMRVCMGPCRVSVPILQMKVMLLTRDRAGT